jgi:hypothetical protein
MASTLKQKINNKKTFSSLSTEYVEEFVNKIESKLQDFNRTFFTQYKKKLGSGDKSVIVDIEKNLSSPVLLIKNQLDELWNYHWMLGQKDCLSDEKRKAKFSKVDKLITFTTNPSSVPTQKIVELNEEKRKLQVINRQVIKEQKKLNSELNSKTPDDNEIRNIRSRLKGFSNELQQSLGVINQSKTNVVTSQFKSIEVRIRDLQESIRVMELKIDEQTKQRTPQPTNIDILNSSEFGTIYQNKRTLLLGKSYAEDYKKGIIGSIKKYFSNSTDRSKEGILFDSLTKSTSSKTEKEEQARIRSLIRNKDKLSTKDRRAADNLKNFITKLGRSDRSIYDYVNSESSKKDIRDIKRSNTGSLFEDLTNQLVNELTNKVTKYSVSIKPIIDFIKYRETHPAKKGDNYVEGAWDNKANRYRTKEELESLLTNNTNLNRIKRIAETEISVAYNLGRLKKLEELGYTKVKITNEAENVVNRQRALSSFGNISKAYRAKDSENYIPILCTHCERRSKEPALDINSLYQGKVSTKYGEIDGKYSIAPPFHVSCWCYLVGVEGDSGKKGLVPSIDDVLILSGVGLLSVAGAYLAFSKLGKNKIPVPKIVEDIKDSILPTTQKVTINVTNTVDNVVRRPIVNIPFKLTAKQIQEAKDVIEVSNEAFNIVEDATRTLLRIPLKLPTKTSSVAEEVVMEEVLISNIDNKLTSKPYKTLSTNVQTFNQVVEEIPDYVQSLKPIVSAREEYYRLRSIMYDKTVPLETRQLTYNAYITSRDKYNNLITKHLNDTRNLKSTVNSVQSQMSVDASREILKNRSNLSPNTSLEDALNSVRSRNALTFTNSQLKNIRDNLALEKRGLLDKVDIESKVLDSTLNGMDTRQKAIDLSNKLKELEIVKVAQPNTKTLSMVVSNIDNIKKELNNLSTTKDTIRSISTSRLSSGSNIDRTLLIDTQETYIKKVVEQQRIISEELKKLPSNDTQLDDFVNLYRSEIKSKIDKSYSYSQGTWSNKELTNLKKKYDEVSNIVTTRNTYQSYLEETEEMLSKLGSFDVTIVDNSIKFSKYRSDNIINKEIFDKILMLPNKKDFVLWK